MTEIGIACQDCQAKKSAVKCLSQEHNRMAQVGFKPKTMLITITVLQPLDHTADIFVPKK